MLSLIPDILEGFWKISGISIIAEQLFKEMKRPIGLAKNLITDFKNTVKNKLETIIEPFKIALGGYYLALYYLAAEKLTFLVDELRIKLLDSFSNISAGSMKSIERSFIKLGGKLLTDEKIKYAAYEVVKSLINIKYLSGKLNPKKEEKTFQTMKLLMTQLFSAFPKDLFRFRISNPPDDYHELIKMAFMNTLENSFKIDDFKHFFDGGMYSLFSYRNKNFQDIGVEGKYYCLFNFIEIQVILKGDFPDHKIYEKTRLTTEFKIIESGIINNNFKGMIGILNTHALNHLTKGFRSLDKPMNKTFCKKCNFQAEDNSLFCPKCAHKFE